MVTTHSQTILSSVSPESRLFLDSSQHKCIKNISINAALTKMDAVEFPLLNLLVEDNLAKWVLLRVIDLINAKMPGFAHLINIVVCGCADNTFNSYLFLRDHYRELKPKCGYACVLDGDQRGAHASNLSEEDILSFLPGNEAPEKILVGAFLADNPNESLEYHLKSNSHCLFGKMQEFGICSDLDSARLLCWKSFESSQSGQKSIKELCDFLIMACKRFSPDL